MFERHGIFWSNSLSMRDRLVIIIRIYWVMIASRLTECITPHWAFILLGHPPSISAKLVHVKFFPFRFHELSFFLFHLSKFPFLDNLSIKTSVLHHFHKLVSFWKVNKIRLFLIQYVVRKFWLFNREHCICLCDVFKFVLVLVLRCVCAHIRMKKLSQFYVGILYFFVVGIFRNIKYFVIVLFGWKSKFP